MKERDLKEGQTFTYLSEDSCATIGYIATVHWFYVELNGKCVHTSYGFRAAKRKLETLIEKYGLREESETENL